MPEIDLDRIMSEIRARADKRRREHPEIQAEIDRLLDYSPAAAFPDRRFLDLDYNLRRANLSHNPSVTPHTRFSLLKRALLRLMRPYTARQIEFNGAVVRAMNKAWEIIQEQQE